MKIKSLRMKLAASLILLALFLYGCGASTDSRYEDDTEKEVRVNHKETEDVKEEPSEVFNMTPYHARIEFNIKTEKPEYDIWYGYDSSSVPYIKESTSVIEGYRVEVFSSDNLQEANEMKSELSSRINHQIYIVFDPPFYRVRVGDYESRNSAENQSFRLRQFGYQESRVVSDSVNVSGIK